MATVTSLTQERIMELMAGWEGLGDQQAVIDATVAALKAQVESQELDLSIFYGTTLPQLQADLAAGSALVSELNDTILPAHQLLLDTHDIALQDLNTVDIPGLQEQITGNSDWISELNTVTLPDLNTRLEAVEGGVAFDPTELNASIAALEAKFPITGEDIEANTIEANHILAHTITALEIAADTITANEIAADAVTANEIAANTITAAEIFADTITGNEIAADTITANEIAAKTITADEIAAATITALELAADTITANEIAVGAITTDELAAGAVTADKVSADILVANEIYGRDGYFGNIVADQISGGQLTVEMALSTKGIITVAGVGGEKITLSGASGFTVSGPTSLNNPTYVSFPTDGRPLLLTSTVFATTLVVEGEPTTGQAATFRNNTQIEPGATFSLNDSVIAPVSAPIVEALRDSYSMSNDNLIGICAATYRSADGWVYWSGPQDTKVGSVTETRNKVYVRDLATGVIKVVINDLKYIFGSLDYKLVGLVGTATGLISLFRKADGSLYLGKHNVSGISVSNAVTTLSLGIPSGTLGTKANCIGWDGTDIWLALYDGSGGELRFHRYFGDLSSAVKQETISTSFTVPYSATDHYSLNGLVVGNCDFGVRKFVVSYASYHPSVASSLVAVFSTTGVREPTNDFLFMSPDRNFLMWDGTNFLDSDTSALSVYKYSGLKLSGPTQTFYLGTTFFRTSDSVETPMSPQATLILYSRWRWRVTTVSAPGGLVGRVYMGTVSGRLDAHLQATLTAGVPTYKSDVYNSGGANPPEFSGFGAGIPAIIQSQATINRAHTVGITSGSKVVTGTGFQYYYVSRLMTGTGIPSGATVASVESATSLTLSIAATATNAALAATVILPKLAIRGDGYARIPELERVVLTSTTDANVNAGNEPPLRIGNIAAQHMRLDGNEIQVMAADATPGTLIVNQGGGNVSLAPQGNVSLGGKTLTAWNWGLASITTNANGEDTITHNLGDTPVAVIACVGTTGAANYRISVVTLGTNTFTIQARNSSTQALAPNGTGLGIRWFAIR